MRHFSIGLFTLTATLFLGSAYAQASCAGLPPASHDTVYVSANDYATSDEQSLDDKGIVLFDYKSEYNNLGKWPNPFFNSSYALALYRDWLNTDCLDNDLKKKFLFHAKWFADTHVNKDGMALWTYPFYNRFFDVKAGWYSGIGQAQIAGVLFRAHRISGDENFKKLAQQALEVYFRPMSRGGVMTEENGDVWIQEVSTTGQPSNILNGHITGLLSLIDVRDISGEAARIDALVRSAINTVKHSIATFDAGFTTFYSQHMQDGKIAQMGERRGYNTLHIVQMMQLYDLDGDPLFLDWAMRLQFYDDVEDRRSAKGSTDPSNHGPGEAGGWYLSRYWSHNKFHTWYDVAFDSKTLLDGVFLEGLDDTAMARDFSISTYLAGARRDSVTISGNEKRQLYFEFASPVEADKIRVDIGADNGNHNVAMVAIMPIRHEIGRAPVADACNHRTDGGRYQLWDAFDDNLATRFQIHCEGFILLPKLKTRGTLTIASVEGQQLLSIEVSDNLKDWRKLDEIQPQHSLDIPAGLYTKLKLSAGIKSIDGIKYEVSLPPAVAVQKPFSPGFRTKMH